MLAWNCAGNLSVTGFKSSFTIWLTSFSGYCANNSSTVTSDRNSSPAPFPIRKTANRHSRLPCRPFLPSPLPFLEWNERINRIVWHFAQFPPSRFFVSKSHGSTQVGLSMFLPSVNSPFDTTSGADFFFLALPSCCFLRLYSRRSFSFRIAM